MPDGLVVQFFQCSKAAFAEPSDRKPHAAHPPTTAEPAGTHPDMQGVLAAFQQHSQHALRWVVAPEELGGFHTVRLQIPEALLDLRLYLFSSGNRLGLPLLCA